MELNNFLAQLANHTHYDLTNLIDAQQNEIKHAFINNDSAILKKIMGENDIVAHRDMVVKY